jgi:hypothetical protein
METNPKEAAWMAERKESGSTGNGDGGQQQQTKPKTERKPIPYVVLAGKGPSEADPDELSFVVVARPTALTQKDAKEAAVRENPAVKSKLEAGELWLEAVAVRNWDPQHVSYEQPPPVLKGL